MSQNIFQIVGLYQGDPHNGCSGFQCLYSYIRDDQITVDTVITDQQKFWRGNNITVYLGLFSDVEYSQCKIAKINLHLIMVNEFVPMCTRGAQLNPIIPSDSLCSLILLVKDKIY